MGVKKLFLSTLVVTTVVLFTLSEANAEGGWVYVVNQGDDTVSVIDASKRQSIGTVKLSGSGAYGLYPTPGGKYVYITKTGSNDISLIDVESLEEAHVISTGESKPYAVTFSFDGSLIYVVHLGSSNISVMDGVKRKVTETLKLVDEPAPVVFNQRATRFYISSRRSGGLSAVYTKTGKPINTVATKGGASELRFSPDFRDIWMLGEAGLTVVDTKSNKVIKTIPLDGTNYRMAMDPDGKRVYLAKVGDKVVSSIDARSYQEAAKISLNRPVHDLAISHPDGRYLWVADGDAVSAIDLTDNKEVASIPVGKGPHRIAFVTIRRDMNFACFQ